MRTIALLAFASAVPATALAWDSTVPNVQFKGETLLFQGAEYAEVIPVDWLPVTIGFAVDTNAKLTMDMKANSELTWPTALTHGWEGITRGGAATLDATAAVNVTLVNTDTGSTILSIPAFTYAWKGEEKFDSLLLPGGNNVANIEIVPTDILTLDYTFDDALSSLGLDGWDITVGVSLTPDVQVDVSGTKVTTDGIDIETRTGTAVLDLPNAHNGQYPLTSKWDGVAAGIFNLDVIASISVQSDSFGPLTIPFTVYTFEMANGDAKFSASTQQYTHPLPAIGVRSSVDFGDVISGEVKEIEIPVQNLGAIDLEGDVAFDGDAAFQIVGSDEIIVNGSATDVIVVEFAPDKDGEFEGTLVFSTNDPMMPEVEVPVFGTGIAPDEAGNGDGDGDGDLETRGCGCNTTPDVASFSLLATGLIGLLGMARRRKA